MSFEMLELPQRRHRAGVEPRVRQTSARSCFGQLGEIVERLTGQADQADGSTILVERGRCSGDRDPSDNKLDGREITKPTRHETAEHKGPASSCASP